MLGFHALGQETMGEHHPAIIAAVTEYIRATLEQQSARHRYRQRYRTFGRSE